MGAFISSMFSLSGLNLNEDMKAFDEELPDLVNPARVIFPFLSDILKI